MKTNKILLMILLLTVVLTSTESWRTKRVLGDITRTEFIIKE